MAQAGHRVLSPTWKKKKTTENFTNYICSLPENTEGMIATTWFGLSGKKQLMIYNIIKF